MVNYTEEDMDVLFKEGLKSLPVNYSVKNWEFLEQQLNEHNTKIKPKNSYKKTVTYTATIAIIVLSVGYWFGYKKNRPQLPSEAKTVLIDSVITKAALDSLSIKPIDTKTETVEKKASVVKINVKKNSTKIEITDSLLEMQKNELKKDSSKFIFW